MQDIKNCNKQRIRNSIISIRKTLSDKFVQEVSHCIFNNFTKLDIRCKCNVVMLYMNINNEVSTSEFADFFMIKGIQVCYPRVCDDEGIMEARVVGDINKDMEQNALKIWEPNLKTHVINPCEIDIIFVPGVAFDLSKNRLGHGKGYYDRFLTNLRKDSIKIGLAYDFQILDSIPADSHDVRMDIIISENRIV